MATKTIDQIDKACTTFKKVFKSKIAKFEKLDNWLEKESNIFEDETKNKNSHQADTYGIVTQIKIISKKRILLNDNKYICDKITMKKINKAIIDYIATN